MLGSVADWVDQEFSDADFGDLRLNDRFRSILLDLSRHCGSNLSSSFGNWPKIKASYRFFSNAKVSINKMLEPHVDNTVERVKNHDTVLVLQDSTYLDYKNRPKTTGLDLTNRSQSSTKSQGLILHNTLAVTDKGTPLGLIDQRFVDRKTFKGENYTEKRRIRHWNQCVNEKESIRWIDVVKKCQQLDFGDTKIVHIADRECDMYEFYRDAADLKQDVLIRAARNRSINKHYRREIPSTRLFDYLQAKKAKGKKVISVQVNGKKKYREATLSIIYASVTMPPPPNKTVKKDGANLPMVPLNAIMAIERKPPKNQEPLLWVLLTNLEINNLDQATEKVQWYSQRWNIETFHKVLKSGCGIENAQLRSADRLKKYVVLKSVVAWRLFWLSRLHEQSGEISCTQILSEVEWKILYRKSMKSKTTPQCPPSIAQSFIWIAKLGGYIGRATDPPPGIISLWRGWQRLMDMVDDYQDIYG